MSKEGAKATYRMMVDAPRDFVWSKRIGPEFMPEKYLSGARAKSYTIDPKVGGFMKSVMVDAKGNEYTEEGIFTEVVPNELLKWEYTSSLQPDLTICMEEHLEEHMGKTRYTVTADFGKEEIYSKVVELGWDKSFANHMEQFGDLVNRLVKEEKVPK